MAKTVWITNDSETNGAFGRCDDRGNRPDWSRGSRDKINPLSDINFNIRLARLIARY